MATSEDGYTRQGSLIGPLAARLESKALKRGWKQGCATQNLENVGWSERLQAYNLLDERLH